MMKLFKDPLLHFLVAGILLFSVLSAINPPATEDRIVVDRSALLSFIQYRSKAFNPQAAAAILDDMTPVDRQHMIDDYIREEALYREAKAMGLDQGDYVIRRRMVQKFEFMSQTSSAADELDDEALAAFYVENRKDYVVQPGATFTHVYIAKTENPDDAVARAETLLRELLNTGAAFEDATRYGDRFLFHTNYVDRTYNYTKSHFGEAATEVIFDDATPLSSWFGPIMSEHGAHLVFITARTPETVPPLAAIKSVVAADLTTARQRENNEKLINAIIEDYDPLIAVEILPPPEERRPRQ